MKILLFSDNHWSQYSSIVRTRGTKYSTRLENQIKSLNWIEELAVEKQCSYIMGLGDFFDKAELNSEEITALQDVHWSNINHVFLVGNHEMGINNLRYSSAHLFQLIPNSKVIDKPIYDEELDIFYLPYILECNRDSLQSYLGNVRPKVILSHNDLAGVQMGNFTSQIGFNIHEIQSNCRLFINGHLHNGSKVTNGIINIGNLTGQNFSEDAFEYDHCCFVLDLDTLKIEVYENPFALNFYKLDYTTKNNYKLESLKPNSIVTVKCFFEDADKYRDMIKEHNIVLSRFIIERKASDTQIDSVAELSMDHLSRFREYVLSELGSSEILLEELEEII